MRTNSTKPNDRVLRCQNYLCHSISFIPPTRPGRTLTVSVVFQLTKDRFPLSKLVVNKDPFVGLGAQVFLSLLRFSISSLMPVGWVCHFNFDEFALIWLACSVFLLIFSIIFSSFSCLILCWDYSAI